MKFGISNSVHRSDRSSFFLPFLFVFQQPLFPSAFGKWNPFFNAAPCLTGWNLHPLCKFQQNQSTYLIDGFIVPPLYPGFGRSFLVQLHCFKYINMYTRTCRVKLVHALRGRGRGRL